MNCNIRGYSFYVTRADVLRATKGVPPQQPDRRHSWFTEIHGQDYPVKQALRLVIGNPLRGFNTSHARKILSNLGFDVYRLRT